MDNQKPSILRQNPRPENRHIAAVPVISSHVLQGLPALIRQEMGETTLRRANRAAGFDVELIEERNCFIPQRAVVDFVAAIARSIGEPKLWLIWAPMMDVGAYGSFGRYVFGAPTLDEVMKRGIAALQYHSTYDKLSVAGNANEVRYSYFSPLAGTPGYSVVASAAAGELLSLFRAYLPDSWRPVRIELDIDPPPNVSHFEDAFQCPVIFNAPAVTVVVERHRLMAEAKRASRTLTTIEDVARDRADGAPRRLIEVAAEQIRTQLVGGTLSIDEIARSLNTSVRTLQRELGREGADFRSLTSVVRIQRATELLNAGTVSITDISEDLGYSSPTGFSRAFRKATGFGPREYRAKERGAASS